MGDRICCITLQIRLTDLAFIMDVTDKIYLEIYIKMTLYIRESQPMLEIFQYTYGWF